MTSPQPALTPADAVAAAAALFGVLGDGAQSLGSERDQAFLVLASGRPTAVLKVSNVEEDPEVLDLEAAAAFHARAADPALPVATPMRCARPAPAAAGLGAPLALFRGTWAVGQAAHWCRCYQVPVIGACRRLRLLCFPWLPSLFHFMMLGLLHRKRCLPGRRSASRSQARSPMVPSPPGVKRRRGWRGALEAFGIPGGQTFCSRFLASWSV